MSPSFEHGETALYIGSTMMLFARQNDLAVEIKSPTNSIEELAQKAAYYLQNGSRMVWLVYPETKEVAVYTLANPTPIIFGITDILSGGDVLPGFELPVTAIFPA